MATGGLPDEEFALNHFLACLGSEHTKRAYLRNLRHLAAFLGEETPLDTVRRLVSAGAAAAFADLDKYRAALLAGPSSSATINQRLSTWRSLFKLLRQLGVVTWVMDIPNAPHEPYRDTRGPGIKAVSRMFASAQADGSVKATRDLALMRIIYDLALRRSEAAALTLADLELDRRSVSIVGKKRRDAILLTLPTVTCDALRGWLAHRGDAAGALFPRMYTHGHIGSKGLDPASVARIVKAWGRAVGAELKAHGLRHTSITEACKAAQEAGMPIEVVMDFSRHRDVQTLLIYRDRVRNVQGQIAEMVAGKVEGAS